MNWKDEGRRFRDFAREKWVDRWLTNRLPLHHVILVSLLGQMVFQPSRDQQLQMPTWMLTKDVVMA
jgi:hypothetical protein